MPADNLQLMQERRFHLWRGWLGATSVLMAAGAAAWLLTLYTHPPILAACLLIAAIGWTLFQCAGASVPGIVSWMAAAATLSVALWTPISIDVFWFPIAGLFVVGGFLLSLPAGICFLLASLKSPKQCAGNCAACMIVLFTLVIYWTSGGTMRSYRVGPEAVQQTRQLIVTLHRLTAEIEAIRVRLGRLPKDEAELVALRGRPMPPYSRQFRVRYTRDDEGSYQLHCNANQFWGDHWDLFPWIVCFYGPDAVQRLQVVAF